MARWKSERTQWLEGKGKCPSISAKPYFLVQELGHKCYSLASRVVLVTDLGAAGGFPLLAGDQDPEGISRKIHSWFPAQVYRIRISRKGLKNLYSF